MAFIAFLGCDGSGKSAVISGLAEQLDKAGIPVALGHWRPKPLTLKGDGSAKPSDDPHGLPPRGLVSSILKLSWLWSNWWAGWFQGLQAASRNGVLLFDRYHV